MCLEDEFRDETSSDPPDTEYYCLSTVQDEQSELDGTSGIDVPEDQSNSNTDRRAPDVDTTHGNRTRLHKNEEQDMNNQCGYEQQKKDHALVSLTSVIQTMVLISILMFWRTLQKQHWEDIHKCGRLCEPF